MDGAVEYTAEQVYELFKATLEVNPNISIFAWCAANGVTRSHAYEFLNGDRGPSRELLWALGLKKRVTYVMRDG